MARELLEAMVVLEEVHKSFRLPHERHTGIKQLVVNFYQRHGYEKQHVLKGVSFEIKKGEFFGIVGRNGSGKSTLLKLLAGIYIPDRGHVKVHGRLTPFIELGVGFNPELTGRENVYLNGALLGFSHKEMDQMYDKIVAFAELEKFMDQKLKNYSSGMQVRLAFSIAIRAESDILLIDEVLAVGDAAFQVKCFDYFQTLKKKGTTVIFVSHDRPSLERYCDRGILIDNGRIIEAGAIQAVLKAYSGVVLEELSETVEVSEPKSKTAIKPTHAAIANIATLGSSNTPKKKFAFGEDIYVRFEVEFMKKVVNPILGVTLWQKNVEKPVFANNTFIDGIRQTGTYQPGERISFRLKLPNTLNDGEYYLEPAITNESASVFFDQKPRATTFFISGSENPYSLLSSNDHIDLKRH